MVLLVLVTLLVTFIQLILTVYSLYACLHAGRSDFAFFSKDHALIFGPACRDPETDPSAKIARAPRS